MVRFDFTEGGGGVLTLYPHNQAAYERAARMLARSKRAAVIHPTGTGKSYIAFRLCEEHPSARVLWLSPSEHIFRMQLRAAEKDGFSAHNITFMTYARLAFLTEEEGAALAPDYIVLDEFHRAGAQEWVRHVLALLRRCAGVPVLGLTATNIRYLDNQRDMAEELFGGNVASRMTLGEAIARGILSAPVYVTALYDCGRELAKYERHVRSARSQKVRDAGEKYLQALRRALEKADGLDVIFQRHLRPDGKYLVFCAGRADMEELLNEADAMFGGVNGQRRIYRVFSEDARAEKTLDAFACDHAAGLKLLYCIDMLNEGIHVADVDGVILFRPTVSPIIYKQQIGRALSADMGGGEPVIIDIVNNFENLYSIGVIEEEMNEAIGYYRMTGENERIVNERFRVIDEVRECRKLFDALEDTLTASWELMYRHAAAYYAAHGDLNVPQRYKTAEGYSLGSWVSTQRSIRNGTAAGALTEERIQKLDAIGMVWSDYRALAFERGHGAAKRYFEAHGDLDVPARYVDGDGYPLGAWISTMRKSRSGDTFTGVLNRERAAMLDELGMIWDKNDYLFERNFAAAQAYFAAHGDLNVPVRYRTEDGINLGAWLHDLKRRKDSLDAEKVARLDAIGMVWQNDHERNFEEGCAALRQYVKSFGNANVPVGYVAPSGFKLGTWLAVKRVNGGKNLSPSRKEKLSGLGVAFTVEDPWEKKYCLAKTYYESHGDLNVPPAYKANGVWLSKWLNEQKQIYRGNRTGKKLSPEQIGALERIGICWSPNDEDAWNRQFAAAEKYYQSHGDLNIPKDFVSEDGKRLGQWLIVQRRKYKQGTLSDERIARLQSIGIRWEGSRGRHPHDGKSPQAARG